MPATQEVQSGQYEETIEKGSLQKHIEYLRCNWWREDLPPNWADLPGTGFQMQTQLNLLGEESQWDKARWLSQTEQDIKGFILEYLAEGLVFPIFYKVKRGEGRVTAPLYGDKNIEDTVSEQERDGSVKRSVRKIQQFFLNSNTPDGALAIMTSPSGWSGFTDQEGRPIVYPDSQTHIFQKRTEEIVGFTIRTDFSLEEHRELLKRLQGYDIVLREATVSDYVNHVVGIIPVNTEMKIQNIVDTMKGTRIDISQSYFAYKDRSWDEVYRDLDRREELWRFDERTKEIVEEFKEYVFSHHLTREGVKEALAVTVFRVAKFLRGEKHHQVSKSYKGDIPYGHVLREVQSLPGCAGGGNDNFVDSITPRHTLSADVMNCVTCPFCNKIVDAILTEDEIICPDCKKSAKRSKS